MVKKIAILTSGGDSPGMNTAVATLIRVAIQNNMKPYIIKDGYLGMYNG
jgi:6-phosphofructokinase 1